MSLAIPSHLSRPIRTVYNSSACQKHYLIEKYPLQLYMRWRDFSLILFSLWMPLTISLFLHILWLRRRFGRKLLFNLKLLDLCIATLLKYIVYIGFFFIFLYLRLITTSCEHVNRTLLDTDIIRPLNMRATVTHCDLSSLAKECGIRLARKFNQNTLPLTATNLEKRVCLKG